MIEEIRNQLLNKEFKNTQVNVNGLYLYSKVTEEDVDLVILIDFKAGGISSYEQYFSVKNQIYRNFKDRNDKKILIQTLIFTNQVESVKEIAINDWDAWIVDTSNLNLVVYENQRSDFGSIRADIENTLSVKKSESYLNSYNYTNSGNSYDRPYGEAYNDSNVPKASVGRYFTKINTIIVLLNVIIFFISDGLLFGGNADKITSMGALYWPAVFYEKEYYRLFTYMFLHGGISHLVNNMIILLFIGDNLERAVGKIKYMVIYFGAGILAGAASIGYNMLKNISVVSVGASGAIFGVVGALAYIVIINKGRLENISTRQIILFVFLSLYGGFTSQGVDNTAHVAGLIAGVLFGIVLYRRRKKRDTERGY
ncbi:MAG: Rhomboid family protein [Anaerocolumna sp.]|jgi:rhomboid protease GluP|nr:Rhomboid family protein [Anaerocolumna sp.]